MIVRNCRLPFQGAVTEQHPKMAVRKTFDMEFQLSSKIFRYIYCNGGFDQAAILSEIKRVHTNFLKDSASRKTKAYVRVRLTALDNLWAECKQNDEQLLELDDKSHEYFTDDIIQVIQDWYEGTRSEILSWEMKLHASPAPAQPEGTTSAGTESSKKVTIQFDSTRFEQPKVMDTLTELQQLQNANFRAFKRLAININIDN
ncbi:hypothetical protein ACJJTC_005643 [Scirpophaga incertulas]